MELGGSSAPRVPLSTVALTVVGVVLLNLTCAYVLARAASLRVIELPDSLLWSLAALGVLSGLLAVLRWRAFVAEARLKAAARGDGDVRSTR